MKFPNYLKLLTISAFATLLLPNCSTPPEVKHPTPQVVEKPTPPPPAPEPLVFPAFNEGDVSVKEVVAESGTKQYQIGDLMVIHRPTPENDVVTVRLTLLGGTIDYPRDKGGIEMLALNVATSGGTKTTPRPTFNQTLDQMGSSISSFTGDDTSGYQFTSVREAFLPTWKLFEQVVLEPAMPESEIEKNRAQQLANIATRLDSPDSAVNYLATELMFKDHPYSNVQLGSIESVKSLTRQELINFQQHQLDASKMLLVVVGDIPENQLLEAIKGSFGRLKGSGEKLPPLPPIVSQPNSQSVLNRDLPTNYILGYTTAPLATDPDYYPFLLASSYLSGQLFEEIRTKRNMTYAVSAGFSLHRATYAYLYVTAVKPVETLNEMYKVVAKLKETPLTQEELTETLNTYITRTYMALQTNQSQAAFLSSRQVIFGDWRETDAIISKLKMVTPAQIQAAAQKYLQGYRFAVVGPLDKLPPTLFSSEASQPAPANDSNSQ